MRVSGLLITHQLSEEAAGWFSHVRQIVDELVAFVDAPIDAQRHDDGIGRRDGAARGGPANAGRKRSVYMPRIDRINHQRAHG